MLLAQAPDGLPQITSGTDLAAVLTPLLAGLVWPDGSEGITGDDVVVVEIGRASCRERVCLLV